MATIYSGFSEKQKVKYRATSRAWYHNNRDRARKNQAEWRKNNVEKWQQCRAVAQASNTCRARKARDNAADRAKKYNLEFNINTKYLRALLNQQEGRCALSGIPFRAPIIRGQPGSFSASLDRIDQNKGYIIGNVRFILYGLNSLKCTGTDDDVIEICKAVLEKHYDQSK